MNKRHFIKDPVWGNIELFPWEARLLRNFLFNRLHHVIQNSCAYLVYPGLRYSRFSHSVGVMYVATQIFVNLAVNSRQEYLEQLDIESRHVDGLFQDESVKADLIRLITQYLPCPPRYALLLEVIRIAALLHDLGHLPYSHVFEFALERFINNEASVNFAFITDVSQESVIDETTRLHADLRRIFRDDMARDSVVPIHEALGQKLLTLLSSDARNSQDRGFASLIEGARRLWVEEEYPISKSLLSADLDADRIDFVNRDGLFSGLFQRAVSLDRLFVFYELEEFRGTDSARKLFARPSRRASSEAEQILWQRFLDYKYIASHHKVHLFDELLERLLFFCIRDGSLNTLLNAIVTLTDEPTETIEHNRRLLEAKRVILDQANDSWIDTQLAIAYSKLGHPRNDSAKARRATLYEGLSEQRSLFKSLFKRDEDYREIFPFEQDNDVTNIFAPEATFSLAAIVRDYKYTWEAELSAQLKTHVIIGDLSNKLRIGIKDKYAAEFFGLSALMQFLQSKYQTSRPFNAWYYSPTGQVVPQHADRIKDFLKAKIADVMSVESTSDSEGRKP